MEREDRTRAPRLQQRPEVAIERPETGPTGSHLHGDALQHAIGEVNETAVQEETPSVDLYNNLMGVSRKFRQLVERAQEAPAVGSVPA